MWNPKKLNLKRLYIKSTYHFYLSMKIFLKNKLLSTKEHSWMEQRMNLNTDGICLRCGCGYGHRWVLLSDWGPSLAEKHLCTEGLLGNDQGWSGAPALTDCLTDASSLEMEKEHIHIHHITSKYFTEGDFPLNRKIWRNGTENKAG